MWVDQKSGKEWMCFTQMSLISGILYSMWHKYSKKKD